METRILGRTGLAVTPVGLGLAALGRPGYINLGHAADLSGGRDIPAMQAHAYAVLDALALAAALARPWADVVLSGATTPDQLRANLVALAVPWDDEAEHAAGRLAESPDDYWNTRARLPWS